MGGVSFNIYLEQTSNKSKISSKITIKIKPNDEYYIQTKHLGKINKTGKQKNVETEINNKNIDCTNTKKVTESNTKNQINLANPNGTDNGKNKFFFILFILNFSTYIKNCMHNYYAQTKFNTRQKTNKKIYSSKCIYAHLKHLNEAYCALNSATIFFKKILESFLRHIINSHFYINKLIIKFYQTKYSLFRRKRKFLKKINKTLTKRISTDKQIQLNCNFKLIKVKKLKKQKNKNITIKEIYHYIVNTMTSKRNSLTETADAYKAANNVLSEINGDNCLNFAGYTSPFDKLNQDLDAENYLFMEKQLSTNGRTLSMVNSIQKKDLIVNLNTTANMDSNKDKINQKKKKEVNTINKESSKKGENFSAFGRTVHNQQPKSTNVSKQMEGNGTSSRVRYKEVAAQMATKNDELQNKLMEQEKMINELKSATSNTGMKEKNDVSKTNHANNNRNNKQPADNNPNENNNQRGILGRVMTTLSNSFFNNSKQMDTSVHESEPNNDKVQYLGQPICASTQMNNNVGITSIPDTQNNLINLETNLMNAFNAKNSKNNSNATPNSNLTEREELTRNENSKKRELSRDEDENDEKWYHKDGKVAKMNYQVANSLTKKVNSTRVEDESDESDENTLSGSIIETNGLENSNDEEESLSNTHDDHQTASNQEVNNNNDVDLIVLNQDENVQEPHIAASSKVKLSMEKNTRTSHVQGNFKSNDPNTRTSNINTKETPASSTQSNKTVNEENLDISLLENERKAVKFSREEDCRLTFTGSGLQEYFEKENNESIMNEVLRCFKNRSSKLRVDKIKKCRIYFDEEINQYALLIVACNKEDALKLKNKWPTNAFTNGITRVRNKDTWTICFDLKPELDENNVNRLASFGIYNPVRHVNHATNKATLLVKAKVKCMENFLKLFRTGIWLNNSHIDIFPWIYPPRLCNTCGKYGHNDYESDCKSAQNSIRCLKCGGQHITKDCQIKSAAELLCFYCNEEGDDDNHAAFSGIECCRFKMEQVKHNRYVFELLQDAGLINHEFEALKQHVQATARNKKKLVKPSKIVNTANGEQTLDKNTLNLLEKFIINRFNNGIMPKFREETENLKKSLNKRIDLMQNNINKVNNSIKDIVDTVNNHGNYIGALIDGRVLENIQEIRNDQREQMQESKQTNDLLKKLLMGSNVINNNGTHQQLIGSHNQQQQLRLNSKILNVNKENSAISKNVASHITVSTATADVNELN